jgi:hypothetical protein
MGLRRRLLMQHADIIGQTLMFDGAILFLPKKLPELVSAFALFDFSSLI